MAIQRRRSPRERRLESDLRAMQQLARESSIITFETQGNPAEVYRVFFQGKGLWKPAESQEVLMREHHEVSITLTSAYPRMIPELAWQTPIFHPNISASGVVCLGGYGTHWVPSLKLDELCHMLWDMIRYKNFDIESPYNREAAVWTKQQDVYSFPVDDRPLRNEIERARAEEASANAANGAANGPTGQSWPESMISPSGSNSPSSNSSGQPDVQFLEPEPGMLSEKNGDNDIMFIE